MSFNKVEGAIETCFCGTKIYCRLKGKGGKFAKLQWQNEDGTAHYDFNFKTKETKCIIPGSKPEEPKPEAAGAPKAQEPKTDAKDTTDEYLKKRQQEILSQNKPGSHLQEMLEQHFKLVQQIESFVRAKLPNEHGEKIGMYTKILYDGMKNNITQVMQK